MALLHGQRTACTGLVVLLGLCLSGVGCQRSAPPPSASRPGTADEIVAALVATYQSAAAYQDNAIVRLRYRRDGQTREDEAPLSVSWQRPRQLRVRAYQAQLVCDGEQLSARIQDEATDDFDGQVVVRPAPTALNLQDLYDQDEVLSLALRQGLTGYPPQLDLLLGSEPLGPLRSPDAVRELLDPMSAEGRLCDRVAIDTGDGRFVLWVDRESSVLRRMEYPAARFAPELAADSAVDEAELTVELRGARLASSLPASVFALQVPPQARRVTRFVPPPRRLPSELIGTTVAPFAFADLTGGTVSRDAIGARVKVLLWFNNHPACEVAAQQLNQVYQTYRDSPNVAMYAVCVEPSSVPDPQVTQLMSLWQVEVPVVRDVQAVGRDLFQIPWTPTLVVLDAQHKLHIFEVGANPNLVAELPQVLERLLAGDDLASEIREQFRQAQAAYAEALARGEPLDDSPTGADAVAAATSPQALQLRPLWSTSAFEAAGNITAVDDPTGQTRFLVYDGGRLIVELDGEGQVVARHALDLPQRTRVTQLHSAVDAQRHRYYATWSLRDAQVHVFNDRWQRLLSYPPANIRHDGVQDALVADLDRDGSVELCVGFWGAAGVHAVTLDGQPRWTSRHITHVLSLAAVATDATTQLWAASASGQVVVLGDHGQTVTVHQPSGQLVHQLFATGGGQGTEAPLCGIAFSPDGRRVAIGLTTQPHTHWRYSLPAGSFPTELRFVTPAPLLDSHAPNWLIAGPEGSVHIISRDGRFTDHFLTGRTVTGIAGGRYADKGLLLVSSPSGVEAWEVLPPSTAARQ